MKCSIQGCPGEYEEKLIVHTVKRRNDIMVFKNVPAEVCHVCSDILLTSETVQHLEKMILAGGKPEKVVPLYEYA
ncbi:MAG: YgiT-type zinc finger protein [Candidatus Sumerlaeota bacterium]|nr:YgiT-type zinc finger protein [Candidatus Sumerlaeota bacterium]